MLPTGSSSVRPSEGCVLLAPGLLSLIEKQWYREVYIVRVVFHAVGILSQGSWRPLGELQNSELKKLANNLSNTIMHSQADSTVQQYLRAYRTWKVWATTYKFDPIPARPYQFVLYLQYPGEETHSKSAIETQWHGFTQPQAVTCCN